MNALFSAADRGDFVPSYIPTQTAFVMKPGQCSIDRRLKASRTPLSAALRAGLFIDKTSSARLSFTATPILVWRYIESNELEIVRRMVTEKLTELPALKTMLMTRTGRGK